MIDREIKCRALGYDGNWYYGAYIYDSVHKKHFIISCGIHGLQEKSVKPETVGQYVGTVGEEELYEGDILSYRDTEGFGYEAIEYSGIYVVRWYECHLRHDLYDPFAGDWWPLGDTDFERVIGNTSQNPELHNGANA